MDDAGALVAPLVSGTDGYGSLSEAKRSRAAVISRFFGRTRPRVPTPAQTRDMGHVEPHARCGLRPAQASPLQVGGVPSVPFGKLPFVCKWAAEIWLERGGPCSCCSSAACRLDAAPACCDLDHRYIYRQ
jgi:hypothetical protein